MIRLKQTGHVALVVGDVEKSKVFYHDVLGMEIREEDPDHGGTFLGVGTHGHNVDLFPRSAVSTSQLDELAGQRMHHMALEVATEEDLVEAYNTLKEAGVQIENTMNHESQHSIYVKDPDGNRVEIYWEFPDAVEIFKRGRSDENRPLPFNE
ncbi:MAG TPA: VOC family protein [Trebonia sp.]|jgi:catechol 2,3-dioxygenase|nr:VOC family protein [Trebonia sp.]